MKIQKRLDRNWFTNMKWITLTMTDGREYNLTWFALSVLLFLIILNV